MIRVATRIGIRDAAGRSTYYRATSNLLGHRLTPGFLLRTLGESVFDQVRARVIRTQAFYYNRCLYRYQHQRQSCPYAPQAIHSMTQRKQGLQGRALLGSAMAGISPAI